MRAAWVLLTLFLGGAVVMLLELLGTRIVHPWYGSGVYVWAALISVTLASLAAGTWAGGVTGDRWPREGTLYGAVLAAALFMAPAPFLAEPVMRRAFAWCGPAGGAFFSAACLFSLPLAFLGALAPVVLRLRSRGVASIGGTAGRLYAISTLGSLAGTLVVGFVLIPRFGNREVLLGASALLACVSAVGSLLSRAGGRSVACAAAVLLLPLPSLARVQGTDIVHSSQSLYGLVEVIDRDGIRYLMIDGNVHSHMNLGEGVPAITCEYVRTFGLLPAFRPERGRGLCIGLGAGLVPRLLGEAPYDLPCDAVEIDPVVVRVAREYFGYRPRGARVQIGDGRDFLRRSGLRYAFIVVDPSSAEDVVIHLLSREFFEEARVRLRPGGIVAVNAMGQPGQGQLESVAATLSSVFPHVRAFRAHPTPQVENGVFFASDAPLRGDARTEAWCRAREAFYDETRGRVLTDNHNPLDVMSAPLAGIERRWTLANLYRE